MTEHVEIQVTCGDPAEADTIATELVARRYAACVQQLPIRSTYRWQGVIERGDEILLLVKTRRDRFADVARTVRELHSYEVPAITCVDLVDGSPDFLSWIDESTA